MWRPDIYFVPWKQPLSNNIGRLCTFLSKKEKKKEKEIIYIFFIYW